MIDEFFERKIDQWSESIPRALRPRLILLADHALCWRVLLYAGTAVGKVVGVFRNIRDEDSADRFLRETEERGDEMVQRVTRGIRRGVSRFALLEERGHSVLFGTMLFLLMMSVLGAVRPGLPAGGRRGLAVLAASLCVMWLSLAVESGYAPVAGRVRQTYLVSSLLRTGAVALMLLSYFDSYVVQGVPSNVVLQGAMIVMLFVHAVLYVTLVAVNTRQPLLLRALAGVTGMAPALTAAAACALAASCLFRPWPLPAAGVAGALGAALVFAGDELISLRNLGGIRLRYDSIWVCLLLGMGYALMLLGAWLFVPVV